MRVALAGVGAAVILSLASCKFGSSSHVQEGTKKAAVPFALVNLLDKQLFDDCHIKGSVNVELEKLPEYAQSNWDKDTTEVVVYCSNYMCTSSDLAYKKLVDLGYKHVWVYKGGTAEAHHLGLPCVGECKEGYLALYEKPQLDEDMSDQGEPKVQENLITAEELREKVEKYAAIG